MNDRKRLGTIFPNDQGIDRGIQVNHVNVGRGNLTFLVRDLVRVDRLPIIYGRVYDSEYRTGTDFGPGWKLNVGEWIIAERGSLRYTNDANRPIVLTVLPGGAIQSPDRSVQGRFSSKEITLTCGSLVRRFAKMGDRFVLRRVEDRFGNRITLEYDDAGRIASVLTSHGRKVTLIRDHRGRIERAVDDIGRQVDYDYDGQGQLVTVTSDVSGVTRISYESLGLLAAITDDNGHDVLNSLWDTDARASYVATGQATHYFEYPSGRETVVRDALGRTASFHQDANGHTLAVRDLTGSTGELSFGRFGRVIAFKRDGRESMQFSYDDAGRMREVRRRSFDGRWRSHTIAYDTTGRAAGVFDGSRSLELYEYTNGRIASAWSRAGSRRYTYTPDGRLSGVTDRNIGHLELRTDPLGRIRELSDGHSTPVALDYDEADHVREVSAGTGSRSSYAYNGAGFRRGAVYRLGQHRIEMSFDYDQAGNLTTLAFPISPDRDVVYRYRLGAGNEVVQVDTSIGKRFDVEYDELGRVQSVTSGSRHAVYEYGLGNRPNAVTVDGVRVDWNNESSDGISDFVFVQERALSGTYGTADELLNVRRRVATPMGPVVFDPTRLGFVTAGFDIAPPDAIILKALASRYIWKPDTGLLADMDPMGFDKPSNLMFVPPEFVSVNCWFCLPIVVSATFQALDTSVTTADVAVLRTSGSWICDQPGFWGGSGGPPLPMIHTITFGDGTMTSASVWGATVDFPKVYTSPGTYTAYDTITCGCSSIFSFATASATVNVTNGGNRTCSDANRLAYHLAGFKKNTSFNIVRTGQTISGHFPVKVPGSADYNKFVAGMSMWNGNQTFGTSTFNLQFTSEQIDIWQYPPDGYIVLGGFIGTIPKPCKGTDLLGCAERGGVGQHGAYRMWYRLSPPVPDRVLAHEFGHTLGFHDAYVKATGGGSAMDVPCHEQDIMSSDKPGVSVQGYHAKALANVYANGN